MSHKNTMKKQDSTAIILIIVVVALFVISPSFGMMNWFGHSTMMGGWYGMGNAFGWIVSLLVVILLVLIILLLLKRMQRN